jgi:hypothetical protein
MKALIDGDILLYRIGFSSESENANIALHRMDELISRILDTVQADEFEISCDDPRPWKVTHPFY